MTASESPPPVSAHPPTWEFEYPIIHAESREQGRAWLTHNLASARGVWLCSWRITTGRPRCPYPEAVEEAICFGWIDSTNTILDDERSLQHRSKESREILLPLMTISARSTRRRLTTEDPPILDACVEVCAASTVASERVAQLYSPWVTCTVACHRLSDACTELQVAPSAR